MKRVLVSFAVVIAGCGGDVLGGIPDPQADVLEGGGPRFGIVWWIGAKIEQLAASDPDRELIVRLRSKVDGYYLNHLSKGPLSFWEERPIYCSLNFKRLVEPGTSVRIDGVDYDGSTQRRCRDEQEAYYRRRWEEAGRPGALADFGARLYQEALEKVALEVLDLDAEQAAGKNLMSEMIVRNDEFAYVDNGDGTDKVEVLELPDGYSFFGSLGMNLDVAMAYQEPTHQAPAGNLLRVPLTPGGPTDYDGLGRCEFCLPWNPRMLRLLGRAFVRAGHEPPLFSLNVRLWSEAFPPILEHAAASRFFYGMNVEGSFKKVDKNASNAEGVAWVLRNTDRKVTLLIPSFLEPDETDTQEMRDRASLRNLRAYVRDFHEELRAHVGSGLCNRRVDLVVAGYGDPLREDVLPLNRRDAGGKLVRRAGTVAGRIYELHELRNELCR